MVNASDIQEMVPRATLEMSADQLIDVFEANMLENMPPIHCPTSHSFVNGFYIRQVVMPKNSFITSKIHLSRHPFTISEGKVSVFTEKEGIVVLEAPYSGITEPGTRRVLYNHSEVRWTTFHQTNVLPENDSPEAIMEAVARIEAEIIEPYENNYLSEPQQKLNLANGEATI